MWKIGNVGAGEELWARRGASLLGNGYYADHGERRRGKPRKRLNAKGESLKGPLRELKKKKVRVRRSARGAGGKDNLKATTALKKRGEKK